MTHLKAVPITQAALGDLADLIEVTGTPDKLINQDLCGRFHNRATPDIDGDTGISVFQSACFALPFKMEMMERHPFGSQAFLPVQQGTYLVVVAEDKDGQPHAPHAFVAGAGQGVNIRRNVWHGVLCPLSDNGPTDRATFMVVDRVTDAPNLEEHWFDQPYTITG